MNFPVSHSYPLTRAYVDFERHSIPFAAIKLKISMQKSNRLECDEIVEHNYRSENDVVFKNQDEYVILMQDTTLEVAEAATYRLRKRLGQLSAFSKKNRRYQSNSGIGAHIGFQPGNGETAGSISGFKSAG